MIVTPSSVDTGYTRPSLYASSYEGWNFNSDNYFFTTDTK